MNVCNNHQRSQFGFSLNKRDFNFKLGEGFTFWNPERLIESLRALS